MWFVSDDTDKVAKLAAMDIEQNYRSMVQSVREITLKDFFKSFKKTWEVMRLAKGRSTQDVNELLGGIFREEEKYALIHAEKCLSSGLERDPKCFATSLAMTAGLFQFAPKHVLVVSGYIIKILKALQNNPIYYDFVLKKIDIWEAELKEEFDALSPIDKSNYKAILKAA